MGEIILEKVCKSFGGKPVLQDLSAVFPQGSLSGIMGPSGVGKTTLLRVLLGLETLDGGQIHGIKGLRKSAVFQEDRLCENLFPGANIRLVTPSLTVRAVKEAMDAVGLCGCGEQPVRTLSGGMRRRVALLRALLAEWDILLLDEPFKGLDEATKDKVMAYAASRCRGRTVLLVTHDRAEAQAMGAVIHVTLT